MYPHLRLHIRAALCVLPLLLAACAAPAPTPTVQPTAASTQAPTRAPTASPRPRPSPTAEPVPSPAPVAASPTPEIAQPAPGPPVLFVSPDGDDSWSGALPAPNAARSDGPFATLERARDAIRALRKAGAVPEGGITVEIRGGVYERAAPFTLTAEDSGTRRAPVVYRAAAGEEVRLIGGRLLDLSALAAVSDQSVARRLAPAARPFVRQLDLRAQGITSFGELAERNSGYYAGGALELFYNTRPLTLARWPNAPEWVLVAGRAGEERRGTLAYSGDRPAGWTNTGDIWVHGYFSYDYSDRYERVVQLDTRARTITTSAAPFDYATYVGGQRFYFLNVLEELDTPGEWYLDRASGILYLWPPEEPSGAEAFVSILDEPALRLSGASFVTVAGLTIEGTRGVGVSVEGGQGNLLAGLTIRNTGTDAVSISGENNGITSSDIYDVGDGGVTLSGGGIATLEPADNYAVNNHIYRFGRFVRTYRPAVRIEGVGQRVANNLIHDAPAAAILYSGNDHLIELNHIHSVALETSDVGAIYTSGSWTGRGNLIRHNYLHHLDLAPDLPDANGVQAIYLDNYSSGTEVIGNVFYRAGDRAVFINSGPLNRVQYNIFIGGAPYGVYVQHRDWTDLPPGILAQLDELRVDEPPYATRYPELRTIRDVAFVEQLRWPRGTVVSENIFYQVPEPLYLPPNVPRRVFKISDNLQTDADPGFVSLADENFELAADAPALKQLAFPAIPFSRIGLYTDEYRAALP